MLDQEVELSIPNVKLLLHTEASGVLSKQHSGNVCGVKEAFSGKFNGAAVLVFPEEAAWHWFICY